VVIHSASGVKRTFSYFVAMSAFGTKRTFAAVQCNVRYWGFTTSRALQNASCSDYIVVIGIGCYPKIRLGSKWVAR
jgi:hypothetical protein